MISDVNRFLKVLQKIGYPNPSIPLYAKLSGYDLDKLFDDLIDEIGYEKADNFVWNALQSLSDGDKGIRIDLNTVNANGAYAYLIISQARIDLEESDNSAMISWSWGESRIATADEEGNDVWTTIEDIWEDIDMGELDDFENFINEIKETSSLKVYQNCGFNIWFENKV